MNEIVISNSFFSPFTMSSKKSKNLRVSVHGSEAVAASTHYHPHQYMLNGSKHELINAKSQYDAEFRRFAIDASSLNSEEKFRTLLTRLHNLKDNDFYITYVDKSDGDFLPINNDDNYAQALRSYAPPSVLRIIIKRKDQDGGATITHANRYGEQSSSTLRTPFKSLLSRDQNNNNGSNSSNVRRRNNNQPQIQIGQPQNFRPVSSIIDADILPETLRRVKMMKHNNERPLGFYIRDGVCVRPTANGIEKVPGIYISRVVQGGLAESTGLLNVDDEVLEVNGIDVEGKTLDQVTDMMIANSSNLILTIKPANQGHVSWSGGAAAGGTMGDRSSSSKLSRGSAHSATSSSRSSGASGSLPRRGAKNIETKTSKLPSSLLANARNSQSHQQQQVAAANNGSSSWRDAKFRTSQTSQASLASSSSSMSIAGAAGGGGSNHSPYDADDMDEVRVYPANTAAAYEMLQQQQQRYGANVAGNSAEAYATDSLPSAHQQRRNEHYRRENNPQGPSTNNLDAAFINPAFNTELPSSSSADALAAPNGSSNGTRNNRTTNGAARNPAVVPQSAEQHAPSGTSSRSSAMDMF